MNDHALNEGIHHLVRQAERQREAAEVLQDSGYLEEAMFMAYARLQEVGRALWLLDAPREDLDGLETFDSPAWRRLHQLPFPWWDHHPTISASPDKPDLARTHHTLRRRLLHVQRENGAWITPHGYATPADLRSMIYVGDALAIHFHATLDARRLAGDHRIDALPTPSWLRRPLSQPQDRL